MKKSIKHIFKRIPRFVWGWLFVVLEFVFFIWLFNE